MINLKEKGMLIKKNYVFPETRETVSSHNSWIIPGIIMGGPFPGIDGINYRNVPEAKENLGNILKDGINVFVSLQEEITPQDGSSGNVDPNFSWAFPSFCNYSNIIESSNVEYLHYPITDRQVPSMDMFISSLTDILNKIIEGKKVFIHCAGGHGRTGTYSAALLMLILGKTYDRALHYTQKFHNERRIYDMRQRHHPRSPSNKDQLSFLQEFKDLLDNTDV